MKKKAEKTNGCVKCGNTKEDLRFGWCYPCFTKGSKRKKK